MPVQIFAYAISPYDDWHRQAWAGALVLVMFVLIINVGVRFLTRDRFQRNMIRHDSQWKSLTFVNQIDRPASVR